MFMNGRRCCSRYSFVRGFPEGSAGLGMRNRRFEVNVGLGPCKACRLVPCMYSRLEFKFDI